ncbi:MAG TPA: hypothetical protein VGR43_06210 [Dehalococcoidia bacterium]|jgi:hypothetical protein|nr:hypothetical protein [Dehalococcoidia bacterium]
MWRPAVSTCAALLFVACGGGGGNDIEDIACGGDLLATEGTALSPDGSKRASIVPVGGMRVLPGGVIADPAKTILVIELGDKEKGAHILPPTEIDPHPLAFSPDSTRLVYVALVDISPGNQNRYLEIINVDGSGRRRVVGDIPYAVTDIGWSEDGSQLVYRYDSDVGFLAVDVDRAEDQQPMPIKCPGAGG